MVVKLLKSSVNNLQVLSQAAQLTVVDMTYYLVSLKKMAELINRILSDINEGNIIL